MMATSSTVSAGGGPVTSTIEIRMTPAGFDVTVSGRTVRFPRMDEALQFAERRLRHAQNLRELSARCE